MKIAIATDAWFPQINGVVRSLATTIEGLKERGYQVATINPQQFLTVPMPGYASIRLAMAPRFGVRRRLDAQRPDLVHIATEGPIGWAARAWCMKRKVPFTTAFHTRFPDYASVRTGISAERFWPLMRRFHAPARAVMVSTRSLAAELAGRGISHTRQWSRGIDQSLFRADGPRNAEMAALDGPVLLYVGRVAPEKNLETFLDIRMTGTKVIVGDGPALDALRRKYPDARFLGALSGEALASAYRAADCFVFPSLTDTFGLVVIEALACGVPVAGYPVTGPIDILGADGLGPDGDLASPAGVLDDNLHNSIHAALRLDRGAAADLGARFSWDRATGQFIAVIEEAVAGEDRRAA